MAGIKSFGAYIPLHRIAQKEIGKAWNSGGKGEKATVGPDEDSLTMAVDAAVDCIGNNDRGDIDGLFFASTTSPFMEKQMSATIGVAADLNRNISSMDFSGSLRAGSNALKAAFDSVKSGSNKNVVVTAADCRMGVPGSPAERALGDGAAAIMISDTDVGANIEGIYSISDEIMDNWREVDDKFVHSWEERFIITEGYMRVMLEACDGAMKSFGVEAKDIAKFVSYAPNERVYWQAAGKLGFDYETQVQMPLFSTVGNTGASFGMLQLVACLEEAKAGDKILFASYGSGCDVFLLEVTDKITEAKGGKGVSTYLESKKMISNYNQYLTFKKLLPDSVERMPPIRPPATISWRDQNSILRFKGSKCNKCGHVQYPVHRICSECFSKDESTEVRLSDMNAKVFSCTVDNLGYGGGASPFWAIADFEEVRARLQIADADLTEVKIGDSLEMSFRKFPSDNDIPVYGWKSRLVR